MCSSECARIKCEIAIRVMCALHTCKLIICCFDLECGFDVHEKSWWKQ